MQSDKLTQKWSPAGSDRCFSIPWTSKMLSWKSLWSPMTGKENLSPKSSKRPWEEHVLNRGLDVDFLWLDWEVLLELKGGGHEKYILLRNSSVLCLIITFASLWHLDLHSDYLYHGYLYAWFSDKFQEASPKPQRWIAKTADCSKANYENTISMNDNIGWIITMTPRRAAEKS